jgi:Eukaryotic porin.
MVYTSSSEKDAFIDPYATSAPIASKPPYFTPIAPFSNAYDRFAQWRANLGLPNPGTVENLQKEVKSAHTKSVEVAYVLTWFKFLATHLSNYVFDGGRADLTKSLSMNPLFQVTHSFALGSQTLAPSYNFGAIFANQQVNLLCIVMLHLTELVHPRSSFKEESIMMAM